ncbi:MAG: YggS family pyridoxal phosphate-dependent enzyme [candidate division WOR-3 bacterium]|jgi:pyridoxal phosphate enzyme (YggS family)
MAIAENVKLIQSRIQSACARANRNPAEIKLVAVSKSKPVELIKEAIAAGITRFGENRVQEAQTKIPLIDTPVEWHLVGTLQTNKVKRALELFHLIQSVDSLHLAEEIQHRCEQKNITIPVLIEVNTAGEPTKHGVSPDRLAELVSAVLTLNRLQLQGLMTIGPGLAITNPEASRACFQLLSRLRAEMQERFGIALPELSMGMSADFEVGIEEGATIIRIGTALFGPRE